MIKRLLILFIVLVLLVGEIGYLSYKAGAWVAHYQDSWMFLGGNQ